MNALKRRGRVVAALVTTGMLALGACGSPAGTPGGNDGQGGTATVNLVWWHQQTEDSLAQLYKSLVDQFEAANPGIKVSLEMRATDQQKEALRQALGTSAAPDIYFSQSGPGIGGEYVKLGASLDLTKYYEQYRWKDRFTPAALAGVTQYGGFHGVPWSQFIIEVMYNKPAFAKAGITELPKTYDEFVAAAAKLKAAGIPAMALGGTVNWHVMRLLDNQLETECGSEKADALTHLKASWATEPCVTAAFTELKRWGDNYMIKGFMGLDNDQAALEFIKGRAAMAIEGDWFNAIIKEKGAKLDDFGVFAFPTGTGRIYSYTEDLYLSATSAHPDEAAKFLDFVTSPEVQQKIVGTWQTTSVVAGVQNKDSSPIMADWGKVASEATGSFLMSDQQLSLENTTEYWRIQNAVLTGEMAPADAGKAFQDFVDSKK